MKSERIIKEPSFGTLHRMPPWVTSSHGETLEDVAFLSGAALAALHVVRASEDIPQTLLRARLALSAAESCVLLSGRLERAGELRDAVHLLRPGDLPGPAGDIYQCWQRAVQRPVSIKALHRALPEHAPAQIATWLDAGTGSPITRAAQVLEAVLVEAPRAETSSLILADAALGKALGWDYLMPLLASGLKRGDLRMRGDDLRLACHRAATASAVDAVRLSADVALRATRLNTVAPRLRAKGAEEAVAMFLTRDAVTPSSLTSLNSDRAARRFCDRLVELGVARELTGRDTFRLYGV